MAPQNDSVPPEQTSKLRAILLILRGYDFWIFRKSAGEPFRSLVEPKEKEATDD